MLLLEGPAIAACEVMMGDQPESSYTRLRSVVDFELKNKDFWSPVTQYVIACVTENKKKTEFSGFWQ
jgi:hypothetical protein